MIPTDLSLQPDLTAQENRAAFRVLIIDDDHDQQEVLAHRLAAQGFEIDRAGTAEAGIAAARSQPPDVVILDIRLPDMNGLTACARLADDPQTCGAPIIVVSGVEQPDIVRKARSAGCYYYVRKPYDPNALLALIQNALNEWDK